MPENAHCISSHQLLVEHISAPQTVFTDFCREQPRIPLLNQHFIALNMICKVLKFQRSQFEDEWGLLFREGWTLLFVFVLYVHASRWQVMCARNSTRCRAVTCPGDKYCKCDATPYWKCGEATWRWQLSLTQFYGWSNRKRDRMCHDDMAAAAWILHSAISELTVFQKGVPFIICTLPSCFIAAVISSGGVKEKKNAAPSWPLDVSLLLKLGKVFPAVQTNGPIKLRPRAIATVRNNTRPQIFEVWNVHIEALSPSLHRTNTAKGSLCRHGFMIVAMQLLILLPW